MWEALASIGSISSAIVIAVTVIFAARQVRVTVDQLEQVRKATQFDAARTVLLEMADPAFVDAYRFVFHDLDRMLANDSFRREVALIGLADDRVHKELVVLRAFDRIGTYVRFGLVDGEIIYSSYANRVVHCYERLREMIAVYRHVSGTPMFPNFDFLYDDCQRWLAANGIVIDIGSATKRIAEYQSQFSAQQSATGAG